MAFDPPTLDNDDQFIVDREGVTYKTAFDQIKRDLGLNIGPVAPSEPIDGSLWVNTGVCPPEILIWGGGSAGSCEDKWYPIKPQADQFLMMNAAGDIYVPGALFITGDVLMNDDKSPVAPSNDNTIQLDSAGNAFITGNLYVATGGELLTSTPLPGFVGDSVVTFDGNDDVFIPGKIYVGAAVSTNYS